MVDLSLIIPFYNVEAYLERCLKSCVAIKSTLFSFEIVLVDDGSPDNSIDIANTYQSLYSNIRVVRKQNGGLSSARNCGLKEAKGRYIWYVDSDDSINPDILESFFPDVLNNNLDVAILTATLIHSNQNVEKKKRSYPTDLIAAGSYFYLSEYMFPYSGAPFYICRRSFVIKNNLFFKEGILFEDLLYLPQLLSIAERCKYYPESVYNYFLRDGSITQSSITPRKCLDVLCVTDGLDEFKRNNSLGENSKLVIDDAIARAYGVLYRYYLNKLPKEDRRAIRNAVKQRKYWMTAIRNSRQFKYILYYIIDCFL